MSDIHEHRDTCNVSRSSKQHACEMAKTCLHTIMYGYALLQKASEPHWRADVPHLARLHVCFVSCVVFCVLSLKPFCLKQSASYNKCSISWSIMVMQSLKKTPLPTWKRCQDAVKQRVRAQASTMHNASESNLKHCCVTTAAARKTIPLPPHPPTPVTKKKMKRYRSTEEFHKALERTKQRMKATQQHNRGGWQPIVPWKYDSNEWTQIPKCKSSARWSEWDSWHKAKEFAQHVVYVLCACGEWVFHLEITGVEASGRQNSKVHQTYEESQCGSVSLTLKQKYSRLYACQLMGRWYVALEVRQLVHSPLKHCLEEW